MKQAFSIFLVFWITIGLFGGITVSASSYTEKLNSEDGYSSRKTTNVEDRGTRVFLPTFLEAYRDGIVSIDVLKSDERLCANINGTVYYGEYGAGQGLGSDWLITYPDVPREITEITVWVESKTGRISEKKTCILEDCQYSVFAIEIEAYPGKAIGKVKETYYGQMLDSVSITLGGSVYSTAISSDGSFELTYPVQQNDDNLEFLFSDSHGCSVKRTTYISNSLQLWGNVQVNLAAPNRIQVLNVKAGCRLYVNVGGTEYRSEVSTQDNKNNVTLYYPVQKAGTPITVWIQNDVTTEFGNKTTCNVEKKKYSYSCLAKTDRISGDFYFDTKENDNVYLEDNITSISVLLDGKEYACKLKRTDASDFSDEKLDELDITEDQNLCHFSGTYPKQKVGKKIQLLVKDADGYSFTYDVLLKNLSPKIKIDPVYSSDKKISGTTTAGSSVTIKFGKKMYKTKAKSNGKFSVKVKSQKVGTKVTVSVVSPEGYKSSKTLNVKLDDGYVTMKGNIYRTSSTITLKLHKVKKGDSLTVTAAGRKYTRKIQSSKKKRTVVIKLKRKPTAGSKVSVVLKDKFGKKKDSWNEYVYYSNAIMRGMSAKNATLTTWGPPLRKNDYGTGSVQWVFKSGRTYLYVYIRGGKVVAIQRFDY